MLYIVLLQCSGLREGEALIDVFTLLVVFAYLSALRQNCGHPPMAVPCFTSKIGCTYHPTNRLHLSPNKPVAPIKQQIGCTYICCGTNVIVLCWEGSETEIRTAWLPL